MRKRATRKEQQQQQHKPRGNRCACMALPPHRPTPLPVSRLTGDRRLIKPEVTAQHARAHRLCAHVWFGLEKWCDSGGPSVQSEGTYMVYILCTHHCYYSPLTLLCSEPFCHRATVTRPPPSNSGRHANWPISIIARWYTCTCRGLVAGPTKQKVPHAPEPEHQPQAATTHTS